MTRLNNHRPKHLGLILFFVFKIRSDNFPQSNLPRPILYIALFAKLLFAYSICLHSEEISSQFEIIDPLNRGKIRIYSDSKIENEFLRYDFSGYSLRSDQIIDFGIEPDMESLTFTTYQGTDWLDASKSHYF